MRFIISILAVCFIAACKNETVVEIPFFDRVADTATHTEVFGRDSAFCNDSMAGYNFYEPAQRRRESENVDKSKPIEIEPLEIKHYLLPSQLWDGKISLKKKGLYAQNKDNPQSYLVMPFMYIGYTDTIRYKLSLQYKGDTFIYNFKHAVKVDDVFFDKQYNDTIYKISYSPDLNQNMPNRMFEDDKILFVGKHVGLVGAAAPLWEKEKNKHILYDRLGNFYPEKYNYDTAYYTFM